MPELPEVETIARGVHERVRGDRIVQAWFSGFPQPFKTPPGDRPRGLKGGLFWACIERESILWWSWAAGNKFPRRSGLCIWA